MGGRTLDIALGRRSISNKILVDYFVTRERPLYYFSLKLSCLLCIGDCYYLFFGRGLKVIAYIPG